MRWRDDLWYTNGEKRRPGGGLPVGNKTAPRPGLFPELRGVLSMNCDTCPHEFSPEDPTCRYCPLYPGDKPAPSPAVPPPAHAEPDRENSSPPESALPVRGDSPADTGVIAAQPLGRDKAASYFEAPNPVKPHKKQKSEPYRLWQKVTAVLLSICLLAGGMMICAGYTAKHVLEKDAASRFLTEDAVETLTASLPDYTYFLGLRLEKATVQELLSSPRIQRSLDDLIAECAAYLRTGKKPRFSTKTITSRLIRTVQQVQPLYLTIDGKTYISETNCTEILTERISENLEFLLTVLDREALPETRLEALNTLVKGTRLDAAKMMEFLTHTQYRKGLIDGILWGGVLLCLLSLLCLVLMHRKRKGRALLFAAIPLFLSGLILLVCLSPHLLSAVIGGPYASLVEGGLRVVYGVLVVPGASLLASGALLACVYGLDKGGVLARAWRRIRRFFSEMTIQRDPSVH